MIRRNKLLGWVAVIALIMFAAFVSLGQAAPGPRQSEIISSDQSFSADLLPVGTFAAGATTPVVGTMVCADSADYDLFAFDLVGPVGTMTGTAPTLAVLIDSSGDGGVTWVLAHTYTVINATVTPVSQHGVVSDLAASTAQSWGPCFRARYTAGGTTPGGTLGVHLLAKDNQ